jgi:hypothetical protein
VKNECSIVRDLLPLYAEDMLSAESAEFVAAHAAQCPECRELLDDMASLPTPDAPADDVPLRGIRRKLVRKRVSTAICAALMALALVTAIFSALNAPRFFPYEENLMRLYENPDGSVTVAFRGDVARCSARSLEHDGVKTWFIEAYTSAWDGIFSEGDRSLVLGADNSAPMAIYYSQNNGEEDVCVYGGEHASGGVESLARLTLGYYFIIACAAAAVLGLAMLLFRSARSALEKLLLAPMAYIAGHLLILGADMTTYCIQRDFTCIMLAAVMIYCAAVTGLWALRLRRELKS